MISVAANVEVYEIEKHAQQGRDGFLKFLVNVDMVWFVPLFFLLKVICTLFTTSKKTREITCRAILMLAARVAMSPKPTSSAAFAVCIFSPFVERVAGTLCEGNICI